MNTFAQVDSIIGLKEVNVFEQRSQFESGLYHEKTDSIQMLRMKPFSINDLLKENTAISLKEYGNGQLSTITMRGGSAYQTAVLWNGFSVASPLHGLTDLTLFDNGFFDNAVIQHGGASSLWGSGAVSGIISLVNVPHFNSGARFSAGVFAGSYSNLSFHSDVSFGGKNYYSELKILKVENPNEFEYYDDQNSKKTQVNSNISHFALFTSHYFRTGKNSTASLFYWRSVYDRQIPPSLNQNNSKAIQNDNNDRLSAEWKWVKEDFQLHARSAYFIEEQTYDDNYLSQPSNNNCRTFIPEVTAEKKFGNNHELQAGINMTNYFVDSSANAAPAHECYWMKDGALLHCTGDKKDPVQTNVKLKNGLTITPKGEMIEKDGTKSQLQNGDCVSMMGSIGDCEKMHAKGSEPHDNLK